MLKYGWEYLQRDGVNLTEHDYKISSMNVCVMISCQLYTPLCIHSHRQMSLLNEAQHLNILCCQKDMDGPQSHRFVHPLYDLWSWRFTIYHLKSWIQNVEFFSTYYFLFCLMDLYFIVTFVLEKINTETPGIQSSWISFVGIWLDL